MGLDISEFHGRMIWLGHPFGDVLMLISKSSFLVGPVSWNTFFQSLDITVWEQRRELEELSIQSTEFYFKYGPRAFIWASCPPWRRKIFLAFRRRGKHAETMQNVKNLRI